MAFLKSKENHIFSQCRKCPWHNSKFFRDKNPQETVLESKFLRRDWGNLQNPCINKRPTSKRIPFVDFICHSSALIPVISWLSTAHAKDTWYLQRDFLQKPKASKPQSAPFCLLPTTNPHPPFSEFARPLIILKVLPMRILNKT